MREKADILYCTSCESEVIEDIPRWYACYCASREINGPEEYPDSWSDPRPSEPYDTLEEKYL